MKALFALLFALSLAARPDTVQVSLHLAQDTTTFGASVPGSIPLPEDATSARLLHPEGFLTPTVQIRDITLNTEEISFVITPYTIETCTIPSLTLSYTRRGEDITAHTGETTLTVLSTLADTARPYDAGAPLDFTRPHLFPWILGGVLCAVFLLMLFLWQRYRKNNAPTLAPPPPPPGEEALASLQRLAAQDYLSLRQYKPFCFELSALIKRYIGRRWQCGVAEYTSREFRRWIETTDLSREDRQFLKKLIGDTDPVKFANLEPLHEDMENLFTQSRRFIETKEAQVAEAAHSPNDHGEET
ncbi:hypothetical protein [Chitinivibrio alkaliphilus]|uniref:Uncharacterized protein n=1 Tax=Chitinivibrio alkaliphilus ACht1 TaxID=1313304 RepID=U7D9P6_9BACT|nr:hypothetical protein [Chitinivibrio alkaliphilus]ERP38747.1 hypothetical protein CALK_0766 [Chitinivibrio alkaliphilus ACht1]